MDMSDQKIQTQWASDPNHYVLGNVLEDASQATTENV
jgi:hypothetical protein